MVKVNRNLQPTRVLPPRAAARREMAKHSRALDQHLNEIESTTVASVSRSMVKYLNRQDEVVEQLNDNQYEEIYEDSKVIGKFARGSAKLSSTLEVVEKSFHVLDFARRLNRMFQSADNDIIKFTSIGEESGSMIRFPVTSQFVELWPIERVPPSPYKETRIQKPRRKLNIEQSTLNPNIVADPSDAAKVGVDETVQEVEKMRLRLKKLYLRNDKKPVSYVQWVCDPDSFAKTVENAFHAMFLCKEGTIKLGQDQHDNACVEPSTPESTETEDEHAVAANNKQAIFRLDVKKWQSWCESVA